MNKTCLFAMTTKVTIRSLLILLLMRSSESCAKIKTAFYEYLNIHKLALNTLNIVGFIILTFSSFSTFDVQNHFQQEHLGPIRDDTVLTLDSQTGRVVGRWGKNLFYMPHGITIDRHDNIWVTDVALHQAFKV